MDRREILKYTAWATGAAISAPLMSSLLVGCQPGITTNLPIPDLVFFSTKEFELVRKLADIILPKTDSPAASEVGVPEMIDHMVGNVYGEKEREAYKLGFTALSDFIKNATGTDLSALVNQINSGEETVPESTRKAFLSLKQQTIAYYLSSEEIGTKYLNYLPVPGAYEACISLDEVGGKAWAL